MGNNLSIAYFKHSGRQMIDEIAVVGNKNHGPVIIFQSFEQHILGFKIKMVGRLVEQQKVAGGQKQFGQSQAIFFSTGKDRHFFFNLLAGKKEGPQDVTQMRHHAERSISGDFLQNGA